MSIQDSRLHQRASLRTQGRVACGQSVMLIGSYAPSLINFRGPLVRDLVESGCRVSVAAPDIDSAVQKRFGEMGVDVHETPLSRTGLGPWSDFLYYRHLVRLFRRVRPDLALTYTIKPNIWGAFAARRTNVRSFAMITGLGFAFSDADKPGPWRRRVAGFSARHLYRAATRFNEKLIFQNPDDIRDFVAAGCLADPEKTAMVAGSGVDLSHYFLVPLPNDPIVLMIARLIRSKGVREYAEAAITVKRAFPAARFQLVGPFDQGPDSISRAELDYWVKLGLEYLGPQADVRPAIATARIYVLPSYREGTPRSVLEAMAMGRPIITTDAPGCRETVTHGVNGLLVEKRDSAGLAAAITALLTAPETAVKMGAASYDLACRKYDVRKVNRDLMREIGLVNLSD